MFTIANGIILKGKDLVPTRENIVVDDGRIIEIGKGFLEGKIIDVDGSVVCPSFINGHMHIGDSIIKDEGYGEGQIGTAYIDWGIINDTYKNCPSKNIADKVANDFKAKGYYVYIQRMGFGNKRIPEGTPTCYRIYEKPRQYNNWDEL